MLTSWIQKQAPCYFCGQRIKHSPSYNVPHICQLCFRTWEHLPYGLDIFETESVEQVVCVNADGLTAVGLYQWPLSDWIMGLKFHQKTFYCNILGYLIARQVEQQNWLTIDFVCALPLHDYRWISRGYNQTELILKGLLAEIVFPVYTGLKRIRSTKAQSTQDRNERLSNLKNAFCCIQPIMDKNVLLIDDVITTGASLKDATRALKEAGANKVYIACGAIKLLN